MNPAPRFARAAPARCVCGALALAAVLPAVAPAGEPARLRAPCPPVLYAAESVKKILRFGPDGAVDWEYPAEMARDVWRLPDGNVLFPFNRHYGTVTNIGGAMEVTPDRRVVFQFATTGQVFSCQRMADGDTLVAAASQGRLLIVRPDGVVRRSLAVLNKPGHACMRNARALSDGHFLVGEESAMAAREYDEAGALVREFKVPFPAYSAIRLPDGGTLVCGRTGIRDFDRAGAVRWSLDAAELPNLGIRWFAGLQALPNGNLFVCNAGGKVPLFEIARDKRVVWQSNDAPSDLPLGHGIQRFDVAAGEVWK